MVASPLHDNYFSLREDADYLLQTSSVVKTWFSADHVFSFYYIFKATIKIAKPIPSNSIRPLLVLAFFIKQLVNK